MFDLIAYGTQTKGTGIVMATPIGIGTCFSGQLFINPCKSYTGAAPWRFGVTGSNTPPIDLEISRSGTKFLATYANGFEILDLQTLYDSSNMGQRTRDPHGDSQTVVSHILPTQLYTVRLNNRIHIIDDCKIDHSEETIGQSHCSEQQTFRRYPPFEAEAAAVSISGRELLVEDLGSMMLYDPNSRETRVMGSLPANAREVEVITAPKGETPEFLVIYRGSDNHFFVIQPGLSSPLAELSNNSPLAELRIAAAVTACLLFHGESPDLTKLIREFEIRTNETAVTRAKRYALGLAQLLVRPRLRANPEFGTPSTAEATSEHWRIRRVRPDPEIYAPVIELASSEPVLPSTTEIWQTANSERLSQTRSAAVWQSEWYNQLTREERLKMAAVYYRTLSFSGTWLMEYWLYYPFDIGLGGHVHDEEHLFIEVDKLGGRPLSVLASAHSFLTPSNLYSSTDAYLAPGATPPTIPVFAFVELGKHAMAPDIDRDGHFTLGRDVNLYRENSQVWGVRDFIGSTSSHMKAFDSSMMIPRLPADQLASTRYRSYFPVQSADLEGGTFCILPFPEAPLFPSQKNKPCQGQQLFTTQCGNHRLQSHPDAAEPWKTYKPWVYPLGESRWGFVYWGSGLRGYGIVVSPFSFNFGLSALIPSLALPGRLVPEVVDVPHRSLGLGLTYEAQTDNLFGLYAGTLCEWNQVPSGDVNNPKIVRLWGWRGGISLTVPSYRPGTVHIQIGPVWEGTKGIRPALELRVLYTYQAFRGRVSFGRETNKPATPGFGGKLFPGEAYPGSPIWSSFIGPRDTRPNTAPPEPGSH